MKIRTKLAVILGAALITKNIYENRIDKAMTWYYNMLMKR